MSTEDRKTPVQLLNQPLVNGSSQILVLIPIGFESSGSSRDLVGTEWSPATSITESLSRTKALLPRVMNHINTGPSHRHSTGTGAAHHHSSDRSSYLVVKESARKGFPDDFTVDHSDSRGNPGNGTRSLTVRTGELSLFQFEAGQSSTVLLGVNLCLPDGSTASDLHFLNWKLVHTGYPAQSSFADAVKALIQQTVPAGVPQLENVTTFARCLLSNDGSADHSSIQETAAILSEHLVSGAAEPYGARKWPLGLPINGRHPDGMFQRDENIIYASNILTSSLVVIEPREENAYLSHGIFSDALTTLSFLWAYAIHQRSALIDLGERVADSRLLNETTEKSEINLDTAVTEDLERIEHDFQRLLSWSRSKQVSARFGIQSFYNLVHEALRLDEHEEEIAGALVGASRLLENARARAEMAAESRRDRQLWVFGAVFTILSTGISLYSLLLKDDLKFALSREEANMVVLGSWLVVLILIFLLPKVRIRRRAK